MNTFNHLTKKYKLNPTKIQQEKFDFWLRRCKILYNVALEEKIEFYKKTNKYLNVYDQKRELVGIKDYDSSWKDVPNKCLQEIIFRVDDSFKKFFKGGGFPKFKYELRSIEFVKTDLRIKENELFLPKIKNKIKTFEVVKDGFSSGQLVKENNNYYLVCLYKKEVNIKLDNNNILGIDLGLKDLLTDSNGNKVKRFSKKLINSYLDRISDLNKSLSTKKGGSNRFKKVKKHLSTAYLSLRDSKNDYLHKESLKLIKNTKESIISLGDIDIKSIISNKKTNKGLTKSFYVNSLGIFKRMISYKSSKYNKICLLVNERMTSRTCSCCGNKNHSLKLSDRVYDCLKCENSIDRDVNAAINIKMLGSSKLSLDNFVLY